MKKSKEIKEIMDSVLEDYELIINKKTKSIEEFI